MCIAPNHYSYHYHLNIDKIPAKQSDRIALKILLPGLICSIFLIALGLYEFILGKDNIDPDIVPFWFNTTFFDCIIIIIGFWIAMHLIACYSTYKKVFFDGKKITIIYKSIFGKKQIVKENIKKYAGVRFRVEFFQFGFIPKNKFIVELYHKDSNKIAPLFISTSGRNVRQVWADYSKKLNLPQIMFTDKGQKITKIENVGKNICVLSKEGLIQNNFDYKQPLPTSITWTRKADKSIIKKRYIGWDIYSILQSLFVAFASILLLFSVHVAMRSLLLGLLWITLFLFTANIFFKLVSKDKLVIKLNKIIAIRKNFLFTYRKYHVMKDEIETIDVAYSPVSERYFIIIIGGDKTITFGKKLSPDDLNWIKEFLINDIEKSSC